MSTFPKAARLRHSLEFRKGFDKGVKVVDSRFVVFATASESVSPKTFSDGSGNQVGIRAGFVVSKKVGNAVIRNRVKRVLRVAFVMVCDQLPKVSPDHKNPLLGDPLFSGTQSPGSPGSPSSLCIDLVVLARPSAKGLALADTLPHLRASIHKAIRKLLQKPGVMNAPHREGILP